MLLIGSRAAAIWHPECRIKETTDWDVVCLPAEAGLIIGNRVDASKFSWKYKSVELHNENFFLNNQLFDRYITVRKAEIPDLEGWPVYIISSRGLAAIKRSHLHRDLKFTKHMIHYQRLDHDFNQSDLDFIRERARLTKLSFPERKVFGDMTNEEFVVDAVTRHMDHEELHRIITNGNVSYFKLKKDMSKAAYDHELWHAASDELKQACIREEAYVIALERFLIPNALKGIKLSYKVAYFRALEKVCTTLDDGPLREYAIDNWNVVKLFDDNIFNRFFNSKEWNEYASRA